MSIKFRIGLNTDKEILSTPPPQFQGVNLIFTPFVVQVGKMDYPMPIWTDFAGVFLFKWYRAVLRLESGKSRGARLLFWYSYDMEAGRIPRPSFLSGRAPVRMRRDQPMVEIRLGPPIPQSDNPHSSPAQGDIPPSIQSRLQPLPFHCPKCGGSLPPREPAQTRQVCPLCGHDIRLG